MKSRVRQLVLFAVVTTMGLPVVASEGPTALQYAEKWTISSTTFEGSRDIFVAKPASYEAGHQRYPVMYLTDGDGHLLHTAGTARYLADTGWIPELIIVGIAQGDRMRELTPTRGKPLSWPGGVMRDFPTAGGADQFLDFVSEEVIPFVEKHYRTQPYRILAGHSAGGLFTTHAMLSRPELFNAFIAASAAFRWDDEWIVKKAKEVLADRETLDKTFFMTIGDEPIARPAWDHFKEVLQAEPRPGFKWASMELEGESHPSVALRSHYFGLRKIFEDWPIPRDPETGDFAGGLTGVISHYERFSERHGFEVPPPEIVLYLLGAGARGKGELEAAIESFTFAVRTYPEAAYLHDRLGDALEAAGRPDEARNEYERAIEIGEANGDPRVASFRKNLERLSASLK